MGNSADKVAKKEKEIETIEDRVVNMRIEVQNFVLQKDENFKDNYLIG